ncbi:MAG: FtsW/RodA/SpoVE family cell cycle protein, partial [Clostridia bacterium]|nr:FtsW/RodA/SpoVE family cell cycle protein [Clostridia bacterium]
TIWCEEMGFVGAAIVVLLYCAFVWRGFVIAKKAPDTFTSLVAFGITCQVGIQAFLNMMVVCDLIPNTGISLPFFSYGGSALIILLWEMGILLGISRHSYQKK